VRFDRDSGKSKPLMGVACYGAADEIDCLDEAVRIVIGYPNASAGRDAFGLSIVMRYSTKDHGNAGCWAASISPLEEDVTSWPAQVTLNNGSSRATYTAVVSVDAPAGTPVIAEVLR